MTVDELLRQVHALGATVLVDGETLELDAPADFPDAKKGGGKDAQG